MVNPTSVFQLVSHLSIGNDWSSTKTNYVPQAWTGHVLGWGCNMGEWQFMFPMNLQKNSLKMFILCNCSFAVPLKFCCRQQQIIIINYKQCQIFGNGITYIIFNIAFSACIITFQLKQANICNIFYYYGTLVEQKCYVQLDLRHMSLKYLEILRRTNGGD